MHLDWHRRRIRQSQQSALVVLIALTAPMAIGRASSLDSGLEWTLDRNLVGQVSSQPADIGSVSLQPETEAGTAAELMPWWPGLLSIPLLTVWLLWLLERDAKKLANSQPANHSQANFQSSQASSRILAPIANLSSSPALPKSSLSFTALTCHAALAQWAIPEVVQQDLQSRGGKRLMLRLCDVTGLDLDQIDLTQQAPNIVTELDCDQSSQLHLPIPTDRRDYLLELGYLTQTGRWLSIVWSDPLFVPACDAASWSQPAAKPALHPTHALPTNALPVDWVHLTPSAGHLQAEWRLSTARKLSLRRQGGRKLMLRLYEATKLDSDNPAVQPVQAVYPVRQYECSEQTQQRKLRLPPGYDGANLTADLGYLTADGRWLQLASSAPSPPQLIVQPIAQPAASTGSPDLHGQSVQQSVQQGAKSSNGIGLVSWLLEPLMVLAIALLWLLTNILKVLTVGLYLCLALLNAVVPQLFSRQLDRKPNRQGKRQPPQQNSRYGSLPEINARFTGNIRNS
ncbi:MAG: DUF4912 domain-containing protein [Pegethrix bostrychoides GSE-TBD4-15B]|uniref:DUF4912 domain-containing protein n=1 Tax=Pegethrix bostrychoides GSE-TBD4-15B TaxID=2839662 RepID=A0A951P9A1_9CYAN|nr:DUF4912 domain-containing protein [Pegethrix bostrychoides GSE-TBD4-15B]